MAGSSDSAGLETAGARRSPARFSWLLSPAGRPPQSRPTREDIEEGAEFLQQSWQVLPAVLPGFLSWIGPGHQELPSVQAVRARALAVEYQGRVQGMLWARIAAELERCRIPYVLLKGSALRWMIYGDPLMRCGIDLDIGVAAEHLQACREAVQRLGFEPAQWEDAYQRFVPADPLQRLLVEMRHYELGFLVRRQRLVGLPATAEAAIRSQLHRTPTPWHLTPSGELACYLIIDVHHGISQEIQVGPILDSRVAVRAQGTAYWVPRPSWAMFHLLFKLYWEGVHSYRTGAYQYADVCRLLPLLDAAETAHLVELLSMWRLVAAGYFVLRRLESDLGLSLSPELTRFLDQASRPDPSLKPLDENDLGDMWPKLWGSR